VQGFPYYPRRDQLKAVEDVSFVGDSDALIELRPELMATVGFIVAKWSEVDETIAFLFAWLLGQNGKPEEYGQPTDPLGIEFFHAIPSFYQRKAMLIRAIEHRLPNEFMEAFKKGVEKILERASSLRNRLMHNRLFVSHEYPGALLMNELVGHTYVVDGEDLKETVAAMKEAISAVSAFHEKARKHIKAMAQAST
jgi:hypothetical protein